MSEDEEVVFEGHELHNYLCQQGFTDFEVVRCSTSVQDPETKKSEIVRHQLWAAFKGVLQPLIPKWWMPHKKKLASLQMEIEIILRSGLLLDDDSHFLESLDLPTDFMNDKPLWTEISLLHGILLCGTMFIWKRKVIHGLFPVLYSLLAAEHVLSNWHFSMQRTRMSDAVTKLLSCCKDLYFLQRKSLHFVQENELLFRGFTLAKTSSVAFCLESTAAPCLAKKWYVMSGLRVLIARSTLEAINTLQICTKTLVMSCPLSGQLDKSNHYLAFLGKEGLGIAEINTDEGTELPLGILKKLHEVYVLLQSEFLRRLALCFLVKLWKDARQNILPVFTLVSDVSAKFSEYLSNLNQDYKFFSCYGLSAVDDTSLKMPKRKPWRYFNAYVGIHSARLHLQGMLHRTKEIEELLETHTDETEAAENNTLSQNLKNALTDIVTELHSCTSCLQVAISQFSVLNQPSAQYSAIKASEILNHNKSEEKQKPIVVGFTDLDPQIEDEVFEAVISHGNTGFDDDDDGNLMSLNAADRIKCQLEKECSDRMLLELKTVLIHKAHEWEEREAKALRKKGIQSAEKADIEDRVTVESSESVLHFDRDYNSGAVPERADRHVSLSERLNQGKIVAATLETMERDNSIVNDPFTSLAMKPEGNWPLPRLKTGKLFSSGIVTSSNVEACHTAGEHVKTLIVGASAVQPKYAGYDVSEETFSGSGENSSSSESENID
ncbi:vezatin-like isoform X3 [Zootermopsis nevadensis]|uniref:Vezatin n=1 Tax=Zootermopsis nevadensis TaxID=136037 RepID=A0A067R1K1_ZOONE|nr:vezatin-like isoform X3 [Zootermopsis nevadensis]KDR15859.1 Vezatin [Zootermopsis nevadensis]